MISVKGTPKTDWKVRIRKFEVLLCIKLWLSVGHIPSLSNLNSCLNDFKWSCQLFFLLAEFLFYSFCRLLLIFLHIRHFITAVSNNLGPFTFACLKRSKTIFQKFAWAILHCACVRNDKAGDLAWNSVSTCLSAGMYSVFHQSSKRLHKVDVLPGKLSWTSFESCCSVSQFVGSCCQRDYAE